MLILAVCLCGYYQYKNLLNGVAYPVINTEYVVIIHQIAINVVF